jgi:hypothetical protein
MNLLIDEIVTDQQFYVRLRHMKGSFASSSLKPDGYRFS